MFCFTHDSFFTSRETYYASFLFHSIIRDLVLVGRSSILIKGISDRLNIPWSLAKEWAPIARGVLDVNSGKAQSKSASSERVRFRTVLSTLKNWSKGRAKKVGTKLPSPIRSRLAAYMVKREERKSRKKLMK